MVVYPKFLVTHSLERLTTRKFNIVDPKVGQYSKVASLERAQKKAVNSDIREEACNYLKIFINGVWKLVYGRILNIVPIFYLLLILLS